MNGTADMPGMPGPWITGGRPCAGTGSCIRARTMPGGGVQVGDPAVPGKVQDYTRGEWDSFLAGAKDGEFDGI